MIKQPHYIRMRTAMTRARFHTAWVLTAALASGCDLSVSNPGPVHDEFLNDPGAHAAVVEGIKLNYSEALNMVNYFGADAAKEYTQGGRIHPIKLPVEPGQLTVDGIPNNAWNEAQQARWVAEDGVRRLKESMGERFNSSPLAAEALLFAGYANRLLGENMCEAVIDGGAPQSHVEYLKRAEQWFTQAMEVSNAAQATEIATAARAGRASVRLDQGKYAEAAADAAGVPTSFRYTAKFAIEDEDMYNFIYWVNANRPYRAHSVVNTFFDQYFKATGDPRVSHATDPQFPTAEFRHVPWLFQTKYTTRDAPVVLSSGREMRLIEAEAALKDGDWQRAVQLINALRASVTSTTTQQPLSPVVANNITEAWTALKQERAVELWLEARRLGDLRRWVADNTPGQMEDVSDRIRLCFPIANSERQRNPNVSLEHQDPVNPLYTGGQVRS